MFVAWVCLGILMFVLDLNLGRSLFLTAFLAASIVVVLFVTRKNRPKNYKFEWVGSGIARSPLGFEVRVTPSLLQYAEGDHVVSWHATPIGASGGKVILSGKILSGWDSPFAQEHMDEAKRLGIVKATKAAIAYLQLVDAGKIRPKKANERS